MNQLFLLFTAMFLGLSNIDACTGLKLKAKDGSFVHGRTVEFGIYVDTSVVFIPRGYAFTGLTPNGTGKTYNTKYAMLGAIGFSNLGLLDGINEEGLAVGTFYFPGFAAYTPTTKENQQHSLSPVDFPNWILSQFRSVEEVKNGINNVVIAPTVYHSWGNETPPFHYIVYDKTGASIVIEPIDGKLVVHNNPIGVLTNSPNFDWHMTNLRNYLNLTPNNVPPVTYDGIKFAPFGQGSGMVGLPGDFNPPSRFVRAVAFSETATPVNNVNEAVFQAFHLLNQFDIPIGIAREVSDGVVHTDYTIVTVVRDPKNLKYYFKTYDDQTIGMVDMNHFDRNAKEPLIVSTKGQRSYRDVSSELKPLRK